MIIIRAYYNKAWVNKYFTCALDAQEYRDWLDARYAQVQWINY